MLGAFFGDIVGSRFEHNNIKTKDFPLFDDSCRFTDDTVLTAAVAVALLDRDPNEGIEGFKRLLVGTLHQIGVIYPHAGYGGRFCRWLRDGETEPYGSFGNGSAMRVSPCGWVANTLEETLTLAEASAAVTHDHPEGIKGAVATAGAIFLARTGASKQDIRAFVEHYYALDFTLDSIRTDYEFDVTCQGSVPQALEAFLESESFEDTIRLAISIGGDSDTIAAIAGAVAEAYYGMTEQECSRLRDHLDELLREVADDFEAIKRPRCR